jgi:hypothetical protein
MGWGSPEGAAPGYDTKVGGEAENAESDAFSLKSKLKVGEAENAESDAFSLKSKLTEEERDAFSLKSKLGAKII